MQLQVWRLRACNTSYTDIAKSVDGIKYNYQVTHQRCDPNDLILSQVNPYRVSHELKGASLTTGRLLSPICPAVIRRPNGLIIEVGFS